MHHAYNAYTTAALEALVQRTGYELPAAKTYILNRLRVLYHAYLNSVPTDVLVDELLKTIAHNAVDSTPSSATSGH